MRLLLRLRARADTAYDNAYHDKMRGRIWRAFQGTEYQDRHGDGEYSGFCYSNPFPPRDSKEGDSRTLLISSPERNLLGILAQDFKKNPELNIGQMPFTITNIEVISPDVGEPGTKGIIDMGTGLAIRIPPFLHDEFGIETDTENKSPQWRPEHTLKPLKHRIKHNLQTKFEKYHDETLPGPVDLDYDLFTDYEFIKRFRIPVQVTRKQTQTLELSKWRFGYEVQDNHHRRILNLALETGLGERNDLGFGFLNILKGSVQKPGEINKTQTHE